MSDRLLRLAHALPDLSASSPAMPRSSRSPSISPLWSPRRPRHRRAGLPERLPMLPTPFGHQNGFELARMCGKQFV
jgi:hypothetical protein